MASEKANLASPTSSEPDAEHVNSTTRGKPLTKTITDNLHEFRENEGYVIDDSEGGEGIKYAKDGHTRLIPQPSDDPQDPLNW